MLFVKKKYLVLDLIGKSGGFSTLRVRSVRFDEESIVLPFANLFRTHTSAYRIPVYVIRVYAKEEKIYFEVSRITSPRIAPK